MELLSQLSLMRALNKITDMVFIMEVEGQNSIRYAFANEATYIGTRTLPEQVVGKSFEEVFQNNPKMGYFILEKYKQVIQQRQPLTYEHTFTTADGKTVHTETKLDPLINNEGNLTHIVAVVRDMTEFVQRQEEIQEKNALLQESVHHYNSLIEHNDDAVWFTNKNWELVRANQAFRNMIGVSTDSELRKVREMATQLLEPEELEKIRSHQMRVLQGQPQEYESYFIRKSGERVEVHIKAVPVYIHGEVQGLYGFAKDITEQKRTEKELRESEERYRKLLEFSPEGVLIHQEGKILYANPAVYKVLCMKEEENLLGRPVMEFVHPDDCVKVISRIQTTQVKQEIAETMEERFITVDGDVIDAKVTAVPIMYNGKIATQVIVKDISERKKKERELEEAQKRLKIYWNHVSDAVFSIGYDGAVIDVNPSFTRMLGYNAEQLRGIPVSPTFTAEMVQEQQRFLETFRRGGEISNYRTVRKTKDGRIRTVLASYTPVNTENILAIGIYKDVTEQVRIQQALSESEERYRLIAENSHDLIRVINADQEVVYISPSYQTVLGFTHEDMIEKDLFQEMHPEDVERMKRKFEDLISTRQPQMGEFRRKHKNGHWLWLEAVGTTVLDEEGNINHIVIVSRNINERKKTEELLKRAEKLAVIGQLSAAVAHEIRNPLTSIKGFIQLREESIGKEMKDLLFSEIEQIEKVVTEFLSFSKPQVPNYKQADISMIVQQTLTIIEKQAIYSQIELQTHLEKNLPAISCDEQKLKQVLVNVIKNAMESMKSKGKLFIQTKISDSYVTIQVRDEGCGIPKERLKRLGEPFYSNKEKGTGLGLMVCFKIIEEHNGKIEIKSEEGAGTTVTIHLPIGEPDPIKTNLKL